MAFDSTEDDDTLARRAAEGSQEAFEVLVGRYQDRVYGLVLRLVQRDRERALDLAQETFLKAWRGISTFEGKSSFFTWIYRIARNAAVSSGRYDAVRPKIRGTWDASDSSSAVPEPEMSERPEDSLVSEERRSLILEAIDALPEDFREVVILRDIDDRSYEDIAVLLSVPVGTVRSRLHRARSDLRDRLKGLLEQLP